VTTPSGGGNLLRDCAALDLDEADETLSGPGDEGVYLGLRHHFAL